MIGFSWAEGMVKLFFAALAVVFFLGVLVGYFGPSIWHWLVNIIHQWSAP